MINPKIVAITVLALGLFIWTTNCEDEDPSLETLIKGCTKILKNFEDLKSQHAMIKVLINQTCLPTYLEVRKECLPIMEKFMETKPNEEQMKEKCASDDIVKLLHKYKSIFGCFKKLAEEYGHSTE